MTRFKQFDRESFLKQTSNRLIFHPNEPVFSLSQVLPADTEGRRRQGVRRQFQCWQCNTDTLRTIGRSTTWKQQNKTETNVGVVKQILLQIQNEKRNKFSGKTSLQVLRQI